MLDFNVFTKICVHIEEREKKTVQSLGHTDITTTVMCLEKMATEIYPSSGWVAPHGKRTKLAQDHR